MSCVNPLKAYIIGKTASGKDSLKIVSYKCHHLELDHKKIWRPIYENKISPGCESVISSFIEIPCGKCIGCRLDHARTWADRCQLEMMDHEENYFITVTYNDNFLPVNGVVNKETGEVSDEDFYYTLRKRDIQNYIKRLRKNTGQDFRYYLCGEYGSESKRPHYHIIAFGLHLDDLIFYTNSKVGDNNVTYYNSKTLSDSWLSDSKNGKGEREEKGHIVVAPATYETCAYTARYVTKKAVEDLSKFYEENNIEKEFVLMSRKPGIGKNYYDKNKDSILKYQEINVATEKGGKKMSIPKYFDRLLEFEDPESMLEIKKKRRELSEDKKQMKLKNTTLDYLSQLKVDEDTLMSKHKQLIRKGV